MDLKVHADLTLFKIRDLWPVSLLWTTGPKSAMLWSNLHNQSFQREKCKLNWCELLVPLCNFRPSLADFVSCDWNRAKGMWKLLRWCSLRCFLFNRFLTIDYKEEYYTKEGLDWVENSTMKKVLLRNFPEVAGLGTSMQNIKNAFYVWNK